MINWTQELPLIQQCSSKYQVDWCFIQAIRAQENGVDKPFGVMDSSLTYEQQLAECCATVAHRLETYPANPLMRCYGASGRSRVRYNPSFISYFASIWAPVGANNDPTGLNKNWFGNVSSFYAKFVQEDLA